MLSAGASPGNGVVTMSWSRHALAPPPAAYVLERRDADDAGWTEVYRGPAESWSAPAGSPLPQGTWTFRVRVDDPAFIGRLVRRVGPGRRRPHRARRAARSPTDRAADAAPDWFRDSVTLTLRRRRRPGAARRLARAAASTRRRCRRPSTRSRRGTHTATGTVRDRAGNTSAAGVAHGPRRHERARPPPSPAPRPT